MAVKQESMGSEAQGKAAMAHEKVTAGSVGQVAGDIAHKAVGSAAIELLNGSFSNIKDGMDSLKALYEQGKGDTTQARDLENGINKEARHAGSIMEIFKKDLPAKFTVGNMNLMIEEGAEQIYGSKEGHVHYHDISAVHDVKEHLRNEVHDIHSQVKSNEVNREDVGSILKNVEAKVGEILATSLKSMKVDPELLDPMLKQIALSAVERDFNGAPARETNGKTEVAELNGTGSSVVSDTSAPSTMTKSEYKAEAKRLLEQAKTASPLEVVSVYESVAQNFAAAGMYKKSGKYYHVAADQVNMLSGMVNENPRTKAKEPKLVAENPKNAVPTWSLNPAAKMSDLYEKAGMEYERGGSYWRAKANYVKAAKLAEAEAGISSKDKLAGLQESKGHHLRAVHLYEEVAKLSEGDKKAEFLMKAGTVYNEIDLTRKKTAIFRYLEPASREAQTEEVKEKIRSEIRKLEG